MKVNNRLSVCLSSIQKALLSKLCCIYLFCVCVRARVHRGVPATIPSGRAEDSVQDSVLSHFLVDSAELSHRSMELALVSNIPLK